MPLACSRRHLGGSEPTHRAPQVSQSFWVYIFKQRLVEMVVAKPPAWFHWSFLFLVNLAALFLWLRKQRPRFAQGQPKGYFQLKELHRTTKAIAQMNADWKVEKAQYAEFNVPTCGKIAVWQPCRETQPLWNSHDGLNLTCLDQCHGVGSQSPPNAGAKELSYNSLNLIHEFPSLL